MNILSADLVCAAVLKHPEIANELSQYLPEGTPSKVEALCEHIRSPQFYQTVEVFNSALSSGQLSGFMQSFGLDPSVGGLYGG